MPNACVVESNKGQRAQNPPSTLQLRLQLHLGTTFMHASRILILQFPAQYLASGESWYLTYTPMVSDSAPAGSMTHFINHLQAPAQPLVLAQPQACPFIKGREGCSCTLLFS
jgi:hypothetical protein